MIKTFFCRNYRNISMQNHVEFAQKNILLGPNNCGKSNFLNALSLPAKVAENGLYEALHAQGMTSIPDRFADDSDVVLDYVFAEPEAQQNHRYRLNVHIDRKKPESYYLKEERLSNEDALPGYDEPLHFFKCHANGIGSCFCSFRDLADGHASRRVSVSEKETFFAQLQTMLEGLESNERNKFIDDVNPVIKKISAYFQGWRNYSMSRISLEDVVAPAKVTDSDNMLRPDGKNFQNLIRILFNNDSIETLERLLQEKQIIPGLKKIKPIVSDMCHVELRIHGENFRLNEMSDGTLRMLLLVLLFQSQMRPYTLMIDEPEINIHPAWQKSLYELITNQQSHMQIFLSTHSPDLLDRFTGEFLDGKVKVFVFEQGRIHDLYAKWDYIQPRVEQDGWELGDLYRVGDPVIGGWPW